MIDSARTAFSTAAGGPSAPARGRRAGLYALLFVLGLVPRLVFQVSYDRNLTFFDWQNPNLDAQTFHLWAERIAGGDVLSREMIHPYHAWSGVIATPEEWERWYGERTFHQAPLYPYLIAGIYALAGPDPRWVYWIQAVLGALLVPLTFASTRRLFGPAAAGAAALLAAFYGPLILYEMTLLRATLLTLLNSLLLYLTLRAHEQPSRRSAVGVGIVQGLAILAKPTALLFLPLVLASLWTRRNRRDAPAARSVPLLYLGATGLVLLPAVVRNAGVDAPLLKLTTRGPEVFVCGNAATSDGVGWFPDATRDTLLAGDARTILRETNGRLLPTIGATLKTHDSVASYLRLVLRKTAAFFSPLEIPNNVDFYEIREVVPALRWVGWAGFALVGPLALAGVILSLGSLSRTWVLLGFLCIASLATIALFIVSRFRAPVLPFLLPFAGLAAREIGVGVRDLIRPAAGRARAAARLGAIAVLVVLFAVLPTLETLPYRKPTRTEALFGIADHHHGAGQLEEADRLYDGVGAAPDVPPGTALEVLRRRGVIALTRDRAAEAVVHLERFFRTLDEERYSIPRSTWAGARINLGIARKALGQELAAAREFLAAARALPDDVARLLTLAGSAEECGDPETAAAILDLYLARRPDDGKAREWKKRLLDSRSE